jgi:starch phosphorylase
MNQPQFTSPPYSYSPEFSKKVAYFSMEFAIHQPLKTYSGGLGFLAGSHMRSAYQLQQNIIGISILWKYGYYDQIRKGDRTMDVLFQEKYYGFLKPTGIFFEIQVNHSPVKVTAWYLPPGLFGTAPIYFLSTDLPENDYLARTICHKLYDANTEARIAASILLGIGGCKLLEILNTEPDIYHLNESHGLPVAFYLQTKYNNKEVVKKHLVFTNHTPEQAGNQRTDVRLLDKMGFFNAIPLSEIQAVTGIYDNVFDHTLACLRMAKVSNGVSEMHGKVLREMYKSYSDISPIVHITNAQDSHYWADEMLYETLRMNHEKLRLSRKKTLKRHLFEEVADQSGEMYDENILTIVWARRFAGYKRADLLLINMQRFHKLVTNTQYPVQIIWAGKPYPYDYGAISAFDRIVNLTRNYPNCSILSGYELRLSKTLKQGADIWLNTPRVTHEASGTSGMTAAMNGAVNLSTADGWFPEFARHGMNAFVIPPADVYLPDHEQDEKDAESLYNLLENEILPLYYERPQQWLEIQKNSMNDILPRFDSKRMAAEYYEKLY